MHPLRPFKKNVALVHLNPRQLVAHVAPEKVKPRQVFDASESIFKVCIETKHNAPLS